MNTTMGIVKLNLKYSKTPYIVIGIHLLVFFANTIVMLAIFGNTGEMAVGNYLYLLPVLMAIFSPAQNFSKILNLGGKRADVFKGNILTYTIICAAVSALVMLLTYTVDTATRGNPESVPTLADVFGFTANGGAVAFVQTFAFLLLFSCVLHTLTLANTRWYGWVADVLIVAVISVFTPIAPLRAALGGSLT
ncbi:MAG: hypothetical protein LBU32_23585 [Clostridiales bacterium]|jgi:hypothetical protein|nr:hypothetical protein [Clostridiales bacterium]